MHESATRLGWRRPLIAVALLCAAMSTGRADPMERPPATPPGFGVAQPPGAAVPGEPQPGGSQIPSSDQPNSPAQMSPDQPPAAQTPPGQAKAPDFSLEALGEASKRFWAKVFDPKSFELQPLDPALTRTPGTVVRDPRACPSSAGVPDCASAAKLACTAQGFANGRPLDTESKRTCPPEVLVGLRKSEPGECRLDYMVSSSICW
jgi:hypothetical protein